MSAEVARVHGHLAYMHLPGKLNFVCYTGLHEHPPTGVASSSVTVPNRYVQIVHPLVVCGIITGGACFGLGKARNLPLAASLTGTGCQPLSVTVVSILLSCSQFLP